MAKNSRIRIQQRTAGQDEAGQPTEVWVDVCQVWAEIRDITGREFVAAGAEHTEVTTRMWIWRRADITAAMRVIRGDRVYDISAALDAGQKDTVLMCKKVTP